MNLTRRPLPFALQASLLGALPLAFAFAPATDTLDLTPRFVEGQTITVTQEVTGEGVLDEMAAMLDGAQVFGDGVEAEMAVSGDIVMSETILAVRDGQIAKMRVTADTMDIAMNGSYDMAGESDSVDESMEVELVGRTIELTVDEDGEVTRTDVTEDVEPLEPGLMAGVTHKNHFEMMLPTEPVEEGVPFELAPEWETLMRDALGSMDSADLGAEEREMAEKFMGAFIDATSVEAIGKVTGVEDGIATIEYDMSMDMNMDDLMSLIMDMVPPEEAEQIPPGVEALIEVTVEMTGLGKFDLKAGHMLSVDLAGDFEASMSGSLDMQGSAASAELLMSGSMGIKSTLSYE